MIAAKCLTLVLATACLGSVAVAEEFKPDAGFTALFNGNDFTGWKQTKGGDLLDGKTDAYGKRFVTVDGGFKIDPAVKGDVHIETQKPMPKSVRIKFEFKPDAKCNNDLFLHGIKFDISKANIKELKDDTWQSLEIIAKGGKADFKLDGNAVKTLPTKGDPSSFRIRAEFGTIVIRKLQMEELKD